MVLGDPVSGKEFFDRNREMTVLFSALNDFRKGTKKNIAIIGIRKIGKTSLIKEFIRKLDKEKKTDVNYLDIYLPENNISNFFNRCISAIVVECFRIMNYQLKRDTLTLEEAINIIEPQFPDVKRAILNLNKYINDGKLEDAFSYLFKVFEILQREVNHPLIIFLDEFQRLKDYEKSISSPIDTFREMIMNQKEIMYIISGSAVGMLNKLISSSGAALYGHFEKMILRGFEFQYAHLFIVQRKPITLSLREELISFIYEITNGNPFYLDVLVEDLKNVCQLDKTNCISQEVLLKVLEKQIFSVDGRIYSYFNELMEQSLERGGSEYFTKIIKEIAFGNKRPSQISKKTGISLTTLPFYLKRLQDLELIQKTNLNKKKSRVAEYEIIDSLFEMWIKQVYSLREDPFIKGIELKMQVFKRNISKMIQDYSSAIGRGNEARIRELFQTFDETNVGEITIPKFESVERKNIVGEEFDIFCKIVGEVWVSEISKSNVDNAEIENIKRKIDKLKKEVKIKKVIVISTKEMTACSIELCKEYGFIVWDLGIVNKLLKREGMFRILI